MIVLLLCINYVLSENLYTQVIFPKNGQEQILHPPQKYYNMGPYIKYTPESTVTSKIDHENNNVHDIEEVKLDDHDHVSVSD